MFFFVLFFFGGGRGGGRRRFGDRALRQRPAVGQFCSRYRRRPLALSVVDKAPDKVRPPDRLLGWAHSTFQPVFPRLFDPTRPGFTWLDWV